MFPYMRGWYSTADLSLASGHETAAVLLPAWFCNQLITKPGNKTATVSWPDPFIFIPHRSESTHPPASTLTPKEEIPLTLPANTGTFLS